MSDSSQVECPVCGRIFGSGVITEHVNSCLNDERPQKNDRQSKKRKSSDWDFLTQAHKSNGKSAQSAKFAKSTQSKGKAKVDLGSTRRGSEISVEGTTVSRGNEDDSDIEVIEDEDVEVKDTQTCVTDSRKDALSTRKDRQANKNSYTSKTGGSVEKTGMSSSSFMAKAMQSKSVSNIKSVNNVPLAERMRPQDFENYVGQNQAVGKKSLLHTVLLRGDSIPSMVLWGPPGCGKTTLAKIIARRCKEQGHTKFVPMSATSASVNEVKDIAKIARNDLKMFRRKTILFLDEIHRFNKNQQDVLLPFVEDGTITLIGATTENPSFYVNGALLSRCRVIVLEKLQIEDVKRIIARALSEVGVVLAGEGVTDDNEQSEDVSNSSVSDRSTQIVMQRDALDVLAGLVDGDARAALNGLQLAVEGSLAGRSESADSPLVITVDVIKEALQRSHVLYDKTELPNHFFISIGEHAPWHIRCFLLTTVCRAQGEEHYNIISAMIKSLRGSNATAALYWMIRMMEGGENPLFVARRLVIFASEDIGMADSQALTQAVATHQACQFIGLPECLLNLTHCIIYLARAPKCNEVVQALNAAKACVRNHEGALPSVPLHLRNAPTKLMKSLGYGKDYKYPPDYNYSVDQDYLPPCLAGINFFSTPDTPS